jgi:hypothetical protein
MLDQVVCESDISSYFDFTEEDTSSVLRLLDDFCIFDPSNDVCVGLEKLLTNASLSVTGVVVEPLR